MRRLKTFHERLKTGGMPPLLRFKSGEDAAEAYSNGFEGAIYDPDSAAEVEVAFPYGKGEKAVREFGLEDSGKGKIVPLYDLVWKVSGSDSLFQGNQPQPVGDCVSRGQTHSAMLTLAAAAYNGDGSWPHMSESILSYGMGFHPSPIYWFRGHAGDGASCGQLALKSKEVGLVLCAEYPDPLDMNLLVYNASTCHKYGFRPPPEDIIHQLDAHVTLSYSRLSSFEQVRDMLASGYGVQSCGSEGFANSRDENGVARRRGHWSHSMAIVGVDDTPWAHKTYGEPLLCVLNSWGTSWIKGSRKVHGETHYPEIPKGAFWARWSNVQNRDYYAISSVKKFPPRKLPDWDMRSLI